MDSDGNFIVSLMGTGGPEFSINTGGEVRMGPGPTSNFTLDAAGNLTIAGNLTTAGGTLSFPRVLTDSTVVNSLKTQIAAQKSDIEALRQENAQLEERLEELELLVQSLIESQNE